MLCKVCGAQIPDDSKECEFCGAKTGNAENEGGAGDETKVISSEEIKNAAAGGASGAAGGAIFDENEKKRQEQMQKMMEDKKRQLSEIERRRSEKRQRQKRNKIILIAALCALAAGAAGVGAYYVAQNVSTPAAVEETPVPTVAAMTTVTPSPAATVSPSPALSMTPAPNAGNSSAGASNTNTNTQSWTASGSGNSGGSSSQSKAASGTSSGGASSGGGSSKSSGGSSSSAQSVSNSGITSDKISSQLVTGGEVIYNSGTGRYLMTFTSNGKRYYANVSEGSTTDQIQNKPYTINAEPTQESYNGNTVYEITAMTNYSGDYILQNSGTRLLTDSDIKGMSKYDLALARNEIYARHGRKFQTDEYNKYFSSKSWYSVNPDYNYSDDDSNLNEIEKKNVQFILNAEK